VWTPSDNFIKPQIADQVALGYFKNFKDEIHVFAVTYYKRVQNRLDYIDGANLIAKKSY
jgi:excinuclease UvrABC nuclease subunit